jgi:hypothetical protein
LRRSMSFLVSFSMSTRRWSSSAETGEIAC